MTNTDLLEKLKNLADTIVLDDVNHEYSRDEAAALYIKFTGACLTGVADFIDKFSPDDVFTVVDILELTKTEEYGIAFVEKLVGEGIEIAKQYGGGVTNVTVEPVTYDDTYTLDKKHHSVSFNRGSKNIQVHQKNDSGKITYGKGKNIDVNVDSNVELVIEHLDAEERVLICSVSSKDIFTRGTTILAKTIKFDSQTSGTTNLDLKASNNYIVTVATVGSATLKLHSDKPITFNSYGLNDYGRNNVKVRYPVGTKIKPTGKIGSLSIDSKYIDTVNGVEAHVASNVNGTIRISCDLQSTIWYKYVIILNVYKWYIKHMKRE